MHSCTHSVAVIVAVIEVVMVELPVGVGIWPVSVSV